MTRLHFSLSGAFWAHPHSVTPLSNNLFGPVLSALLFLSTVHIPMEQSTLLPHSRMFTPEGQKVSAFLVLHTQAAPKIGLWEHAVNPQGG